MKKSLYTQEDKLFQNHMSNKKGNSLSTEDKELFKNWIHHLNDKEKLKEIKTQHRDTKIEKKVSENKMNDDLLFKLWIDKTTIPTEYTSSHKKPPKKKPNHIIPTIDLHGYTRQDAMASLHSFLCQLPPNTKKAKIIHGKGLSQGKISIIKIEVRNWLAYQKKHYQWLLDYSYETPENGGHGATIIWIKQGEYYAKYKNC